MAFHHKRTSCYLSSIAPRSGNLHLTKRSSRSQWRHPRRQSLVDRCNRYMCSLEESCFPGRSPSIFRTAAHRIMRPGLLIPITSDESSDPISASFPFPWERQSLSIASIRYLLIAFHCLSANQSLHFPHFILRFAKADCPYQSQM